MRPSGNFTKSFSSTFDGTLSQKTFDNSDSGLYFGGAGPNNFILFDMREHRYFNLSFVNALNSLGGNFDLNLASSYGRMNCSPFRRVTAGSLTTLAVTDIPEPGTAGLLLPALGMKGWMACRRKQQAAR